MLQQQQQLKLASSDFEAQGKHCAVDRSRFLGRENNKTAAHAHCDCSAAVADSGENNVPLQRVPQTGFFFFFFCCYCCSITAVVCLLQRTEKTEGGGKTCFRRSKHVQSVALTLAEWRAVDLDPWWWPREAEMGGIVTFPNVFPFPGPLRRRRGRGSSWSS